VRAPRSDPIAEPADQQAGDHRDCHGRDDRVADLFLGQMQFLADHGHQRREPEPAEKAQEKRQPRHVEGAHGSAPEIEQTNSSRFIAQVHVESPLFRRPLACAHPYNAEVVGRLNAYPTWWRRRFRLRWLTSTTETGNWQRG